MKSNIETTARLDPASWNACLYDTAWPAFVNHWPAAKLEVKGLTGRILKGDHGWIIFMEADRDISMPTHRHGAQWGVVLDGRMELIIGDHSRIYERGETHFIPAGVDHAATLFAGWRGLYVFDRATVP